MSVDDQRGLLRAAGRLGLGGLGLVVCVEDGGDARKLLLRERGEGERGGVFQNLLRAACADEGGGDALVAQRPLQRQLGEGLTARIGD